MPASTNFSTPSGCVGMLAPSQTRLTPLRSIAVASSSLISFSVAQGKAQSAEWCHSGLPGSEHLLGEVDGAVSGCFRSDDGATPGKALTCEHAAELITESLVLAKKVPYLAPTHADITRRHICIGSDVAEELAHEALAEAHHLIVTLTLGVEV